MSGIMLDELVDLQITDGTDTLAINADGSLNIDLIAGAEIQITDGTDTLAVNGDGSINSVVTATDLDIRDLTHVSDSIKIGDGTDFLAVLADGSINVNVGATSTIKTTAETVGTSAAEVVSTPLAGRKSMTIQNEGTVDVFFGPTGVTTATGMKVSKKSSATYDFAEAVDVFMISGSAGQDVRILEIA